MYPPLNGRDLASRAVAPHKVVDAGFDLVAATAERLALGLDARRRVLQRAIVHAELLLVRRAAAAAAAVVHVHVHRSQRRGGRLVARK